MINKLAFAFLKHSLQCYPSDRAFDHLNYFRWGTVCLTGMKMLQEVAPTVYIESSLRIEPTLFKHHNASESSFNSDSPDMVLEQTVNRDFKNQKELLKVLAWRSQEHSLSVHMMAAATASFNVMSETSAGSSFHKELGSQRIKKKDENDVNNIIQCIETK